MGTLSDRSLVEIRRDLHAHPEVGWTEYRTTALVAEALADLGFTLHLGEAALDPADRMGVPPDGTLASARARAEDEGAPADYVDRLDETTGLVATRTFGDAGTTVGLRVDMDALEREEDADPDHPPYRDGYHSRHPNEMHACGHDGHVAIGIGVARALTATSTFDGTLKLFVQPAEEGCRGGLAMSRSGHLDDVDHLLAVHLGLGYGTGTVVAGFDRPYANAKLDVTFEGEAAHAGVAPDAGRNALQAAATAITNLYSLPRDADGLTRVNVGQVHAPNAQNVIAEEASLRLEVRGEGERINERLLDRARTTVAAAASMHDVGHREALYGKATTFEADAPMIDAVATTAEAVDEVTRVVRRARIPASEDAAYLVRRVQERGGTATYVGIGSEIPAGHHESRFDIDEDALAIGVDVLVGAIRQLSAAG
ncbi:amidohydrolase [Halomarina halobia]|uniref:Amidohydrolase n=1 Tax=Halomarina halobia TaxID=3033386 RepID=A0ABD6AEU0_9EURY|nr:amidohydrolase [Halomarina sp. PSR21]